MVERREMALRAYSCGVHCLMIYTMSGTGAHLSVGCVQGLSKFGKIVIDGVVLQTTSICGQTFVKWNSISL